ncbi:zinc-dependent alcohol dehydrogenase family protein [Phytomonospora endophytica]|uniref:NADPH:quinone reductase-like Zn-dependent oxidoreductase n=1 Tax=Phytomonospora endophytica TaxID=714109 RepID=A0A841FPM3_9ACTN|nr:NAD(P)-dependent alcohol dehydrogenase [Phytomonospora endophytica]MBB6035207.1 NADPH:quinone reductase-like Zn-dependent oxidoreductase [Phytomonospora endophytica]GIG64044.1 alcohol dehydrogenase [Phytomonospora endophytica]
MRSYHLDSFDGTGFVLREHDVPEPGPGQVLVRVRAASFNKRDRLIVEGRYPLPPRAGVVALSDGAGEVAATGEGVTRFGVGDRVVGSYWNRWHGGRLDASMIDQLGCTHDGMLTEYALLDEGALAAVPAHLTWAEAATLPCAGVTAWTSITGGAALPDGATVVTLGTGGVSLYAVQIAKALGYRVIATTSSPEKAERVRELGADGVVNYRDTPQWSAGVRELTGGLGADLIVDTAGPDTVAESIRASSLYGQVVLLATQSETRADVTVPGAAWAQTMAEIRRVFVGSRSDLEDLGKLVESAAIRPLVDRVFGFGEITEAYAHYVSGTAFGKVVVEI